MEIRTCDSDRNLSDIEWLMRKYRDCSMDFANDFEAYCVGGRKRLRILPPR